MQKKVNFPAKQAKLRRRLETLLTGYSAFPKGKTLTKADVVITPNEINTRHGTGLLVKRIFGTGANTISIRSADTYAGDHQFGDLSLSISHRGCSRPESFKKLLKQLEDVTIRRILCIPFFKDDLITAIALKEIFNVPLCTYILDDQNIYVKNIPDGLMRELLEKSSLRLAVSPEMRDAYEQRYRLKFWFVPPVVPSDLIQNYFKPAADDKSNDKTGVLIGNVWNERWFNNLQKLLTGFPHHIDWFRSGQVQDFEWLADKQAFLQQGILREQNFIEDEFEFVQKLRQYPYAVIPSSTLDQEDEHLPVGYLSLPSRIPYLLATTNIPMIVVGSPKTAAAKFIERFGVGVVSDYDPASFNQAVEYVTAPDNQREMRQRAAMLADAFSDKKFDTWLWKSLEAGQPIDFRFEELCPHRPSDLLYFIEPPTPRDLFPEFVPSFNSFRRLKRRGYEPDFIIDVGCSVGVWSFTISKLYPSVRYVLIDPLLARHDANLLRQFAGSLRHHDLVEAAISNQSGKTHLQVSQDLYGSSLLKPADFRSYESVEVEVKTLDQVYEELSIEGRGVLKIDVQCAEHLVLEGATQFLSKVDILVVELSLVQYDADARTLAEMVGMISDLGFRYYDDAGEWRSPVDGALLQKDIVFVREGLIPSETSDILLDEKAFIKPSVRSEDEGFRLGESSPALPSYYEGEMIYSKMFGELINEVQRLHRYYVDYQAKYTLTVHDELLAMKQDLDDLKRRFMY